MSRGTITRLIGFVVVLAAMLVLPQAVQAHAGHTHAMHAPAKAAQITAAQIKAAQPVADAPAAVTQQVEQSLTAARPAGYDHVHDSSCDCAACAQSSCAACFSAVAPMTPQVLPPSLGTAMGISSSRNRSGIDGPSLRRPPKSFA